MAALTPATLRKYLQSGDIKGLFVEELGWDRVDRSAAKISVGISGRNLTLEPSVQKLGVPVYLYRATGDGLLPDHTERRKIEAQLAKKQAEHLIVFIHEASKSQVWQWVKREPGRPAQIHEHTWHPTVTNVEGLRQKLNRLLFTLEEQESGALSVVQVTGRLQRAFDSERVTKRFYDDFEKQHGALLKFLSGIPDKDLQRWYASVLLNRLMFIYFIQKKGFLDSNEDYLRTKLGECKSQFGPDAFFKNFLSPLFFEGFAKPKASRSQSMKKLFGDVPYLNGGLFLKHQIEEAHGHKIKVPDRAFQALFSFFEKWNWHLDEVDGRKALTGLSEKEKRDRLEREINPDVLGYIFEKYINNREMGAYYTKEDITEYICANTILPRVLDLVRHGARSAFEGDGSIWRLLSENPDRYIWPAVLYGTDRDLPANVAGGVSNNAKRRDWDSSASEESGLQNETWRDVVARRERASALRQDLKSSRINNTDFLVEANLNIRQFVQDAIQQADETQLKSWWEALTHFSVVDPACGSGAFLFAALNVLEPLYESALDVMQAVMEDAERIRVVTGKAVDQSRYKWMRDILSEIEKHPNRGYFILKTIALKNLYGVDVMEEAAEICKLRLFLKLVAQLDNVDQIEPLPDLDFNIRSGNSLIGFGSEQELDEATTSRLDFDDVRGQIKSEAEKSDRIFQRFRELQVGAKDDEKALAEAKGELKASLDHVASQANTWLARQHGIDLTRKGDFANWLKSSRPFNWFTEFFGVMKAGGFDAVVGNPPFLEESEVSYSISRFKTAESRSIHGAFVERFAALRCAGGGLGIVLPMSIVSTKRMKRVQEQIESKSLALYANFSWRPATLFAGVSRAISIVLSRHLGEQRTLSTHYQRWTADGREGLLERMHFVDVPRERQFFWVPKFRAAIENSILTGILEQGKELDRFLGGSRNGIYYKSTGGLYWKVFTDFPPKFTVNGMQSSSSREKIVYVSKSEHVAPIIAALSSNLFWWWYTVSSNLRDLNPSDIATFRIPESALEDAKLLELGQELGADLRKNSVTMTREQRSTGTTKVQSFRVRLSKPILDKIDERLAPHYGLNAEHSDFLKSYDLAWRVGMFTTDEAEEE